MGPLAYLLAIVILQSFRYVSKSGLGTLTRFLPV